MKALKSIQSRLTLGWNPTGYTTVFVRLFRSWPCSTGLSSTAASPEIISWRDTCSNLKRPSI
ncbi:hypothetical protein RSAG8_10564, partial [Rhizoctonia solani AG-8 WAC10335]